MRPVFPGAQILNAGSAVLHLLSEIASVARDPYFSSTNSRFSTDDFMPRCTDRSASNDCRRLYRSLAPLGISEKAANCSSTGIVRDFGRVVIPAMMVFLPQAGSPHRSCLTCVHLRLMLASL